VKEIGGPIPEDEDPNLIPKIGEGYRPFYLSVFDKDGTYLWDVDTGYTVIGELQYFYITVNVEAVGDGMVHISERYMRNSNNQKTDVLEMSYMEE
jgi:hypothetical protein